MFQPMYQSYQVTHHNTLAKQYALHNYPVRLFANEIYGLAFLTLVESKLIFQTIFYFLFITGFEFNIDFGANAKYFVINDAPSVGDLSPGCGIFPMQMGSK